MTAAGQLTLADIVAAELEAEDARTLPERFAAFHAAHPEVYDHLVDMARNLYRNGWMRFGIAMLWENLRYTTMLGAGPGEEPYRLNNSYRSRYARLIMATEPDLDGVFELRELRTEP